MQKSITILVLALITIAIPIAPATAVDIAEACHEEDSALRHELEASDGKLTREGLVALSEALNCTRVSHTTSTSNVPLLLTNPGPCDYGEIENPRAYMTIATNTEYVDSHVIRDAHAHASHQSDIDEYWSFSEIVDMYANNQGEGRITILDEYTLWGEGAAIIGCGVDREFCSAAGTVTWRDKLVSLTVSSAFTNCA